VQHCTESRLTTTLPRHKHPRLFHLSSEEQKTAILPEGIKKKELDRHDGRSR
jgi:hypothetical protein